MATAKAQNLASLCDNMESFFIKDGELPIYFAALKYDMSSGTVNLIKKAWFLTYLTNHFSFASSMCRKSFTNEFYQVYKSLGQDSSLKSVLATAPYAIDWRVQIGLSSEYILKSCFWHDVDLDGELKPIAQFMKLGEFQKIGQYYYSRARADTTEALLEYKRHLLQHLEEHFRKKMEIQKMEESAKAKGQLKSVVQTIKIKDFDDIELFASGSLQALVPLALYNCKAQKLEQGFKILANLEQSLQTFGELRT